MSISREAFIRLQLVGIANYVSEGVSVPARPISLDTGEIRYTEGIGYTECDVLMSDQVDLAASSNGDIDLVGSLTDGVGTQSPAKIVVFAIINYSTTQTLQIKQAATNGWTGITSGSTDHIPLPPAYNDARPSWILLHAPRGVAVTAGTGDKVNVANPSGATATYRIMAVGRSA
jgi:hypothetical protein